MSAELPTPPSAVPDPAAPDATAPGPAVPEPVDGALARDLALYTLLRLAVVALLAAVLVLLGVPLLVAVLLALVVALPLSVLLLPGLRARVAQGLAVASDRRRRERTRLRSQLRGDGR